MTSGLGDVRRGSAEALGCSVATAGVGDGVGLSGEAQPSKAAIKSAQATVAAPRRAVLHSSLGAINRV